MSVVCLVSGSGTNYREIVAANPGHRYIVFTNRPDCGGVALARKNGHPVVSLSHIPFLKDARRRYGAGNVPRNCPERTEYERQVSALIEKALGGLPDLICLAGYDQWVSDWLVEKYFPRMLNVHPGDTTRGYLGLHWVPTARAILAGETAIRSTVFFVDRGEDTGPVLVQSRPLDIRRTLETLQSTGAPRLVERLDRVSGCARAGGISTWEGFKAGADADLLASMETICQALQEALKVEGDWKIYPLAVKLIAEGRVAIDGRTVYLDGTELPRHGCRLEQHH